MKKKRYDLLAVIMVLTLMLITACTPTAAEIAAEGTWSYLPAGPPEEFVIGPHTFMTISDAGEWTGTIAGSADDFGEVVIHSSGPWYYTGTVPFLSVTVNGKTGGLLISVFGSRPDASAEWDGTWEITSGNGDLTGLRGGGDWQGPGWLGDPAVPGDVYYSGSLHFESE